MAARVRSDLKNVRYRDPAPPPDLSSSFGRRRGMPRCCFPTLPWGMVMGIPHRFHHRRLWMVIWLGSTRLHQGLPANRQRVAPPRPSTSTMPSFLILRIRYLTSRSKLVSRRISAFRWPGSPHLAAVAQGAQDDGDGGLELRLARTASPSWTCGRHGHPLPGRPRPRSRVQVTRLGPTSPVTTRPRSGSRAGFHGASVKVSSRRMTASLPDGVEMARS